jgi:hypothetical protein
VLAADIKVGLVLARLIKSQHIDALDANEVISILVLFCKRTRFSPVAAKLSRIFITVM